MLPDRLIKLKNFFVKNYLLFRSLSCILTCGILKPSICYWICADYPVQGYVSTRWICFEVGLEDVDFVRNFERQVGCFRFVLIPYILLMRYLYGYYH